MLDVTLMNSLQSFFFHFDVSPADVYWNEDGVDFCFGSEYDVCLDDFHDEDCIDDSTCTILACRYDDDDNVTGRETTCVTKVPGSTVKTGRSLIDAITECRNRLEAK